MLPNNSTEAGNYVVTHLLSNPIVAAIIIVVIGAFITLIVVTTKYFTRASLTYLFSLRLLKRRLERENAVNFLTEHYLPLIGTLEWVVYAWYMWGIDDTYKEEVGLSEEETTRIFLEDLSKLSQTLESTMRSGAIVLLHKIDEEIYHSAVALDYLIRDCLYTISQNQNIGYDEITDAINKVTPSLEKLHKELAKMEMPKLIDKYQEIMKDKKPILED